MKDSSRHVILGSRLILLCLALGVASAEAADANVAGTPDAAFAGRWDLTVTDADQKQVPSWLELSRDEGGWKAMFVGRWGNARRLPKIVIQGERAFRIRIEHSRKER